MKNLRKLLHLFLFLIPLIIYSQTNCSEITYKKKLTLETKNKKYSSINVSSLIKEAYVEMHKLEYQLMFNNYESIYKEVESMDVDEVNSGFAKLYSRRVGGKNGLFYNNIKDSKILRQKELSGKMFLIKTQFKDQKWNITQESKKIGKYTCFKATTSYMMETVRGEKEIKATAWYTQDIPFPFGPANYSGLPGLILEIESQGVIIFANKINLSKRKCKIEEPKKGKLISDKEYNEIERGGFGQYKN